MSDTPIFDKVGVPEIPADKIPKGARTAGYVAAAVWGLISVGVAPILPLIPAESLPVVVAVYASVSAIVTTYAGIVGVIYRPR